MKESLTLTLPARFTLPALSGWHRDVTEKLQAGYTLLLDGSAVTHVDSAALQFIAVLQSVLDAGGSTGDRRTDASLAPACDRHEHCVRALVWPSSALSGALRDIGLPVCTSGCASAFE